jgi:hypothetical protein
LWNTTPVSTVNLKDLPAQERSLMATNFSKFFIRETGLTPGAFRERERR